MPVKPETRFAAGRTRDIVCLGRLAVDLYAQQIGARLEDVVELRQVSRRLVGEHRVRLRAARASRRR